MADTTAGNSKDGDLFGQWTLCWLGTNHRGASSASKQWALEDAYSVLHDGYEMSAELRNDLKYSIIDQMDVAKSEAPNEQETGQVSLGH